VGCLATAVIRIVDGVWSPNLYQAGEPMMTDEMIILGPLLEKIPTRICCARWSD
jgi:hypothetical protein